MPVTLAGGLEQPPMMMHMPKSRPPPSAELRHVFLKTRLISRKRQTICVSLPLNEHTRMRCISPKRQRGPRWRFGLVCYQDHALPVGRHDFLAILGAGGPPGGRRDAGRYRAHAAI